MAQQVKDLVSLQWLKSLLWHRFDPWPRNFYMPWAVPKKKKKYIYIYIYIHTHTYINIYIYTYTYINTHTHTHIYMLHNTKTRYYGKTPRNRFRI